MFKFKLNLDAKISKIMIDYVEHFEVKDNKLHSNNDSEYSFSLVKFITFFLKNIY